MWRDLFTNWVLVIPACGWGLTQLIKTIIALAQGEGFDFNHLVSAGGMPSSHAAVVTSLATAVAITDGFGSVTFAVAAIIAMVVMYDATGVRQIVGRHSTIINRLIRDMRQRQPRTTLEADLRELVGHTPFQVLVGAILGITLAWTWLAIAGI